MNVFLLHDNAAWVEGLHNALVDRGVAVVHWRLDQPECLPDLSTVPPEGIFVSRVSASAHLRGNGAGIDRARDLIGWLERHNRRVINGSRALALEISKEAQAEALRNAGFDVPATIVTSNDPQAIVTAACQVDPPLILKHNCGGTGAGVRRFLTHEELSAYLKSGDFDPSPDGVMLLQKYIQAPEPFITRMEFIGDRLLYAMKVDTTGGFELCPADGCAVDGPPKFSWREGFDDPIVEQCRVFMRVHGIDVAGFEFIEDERGRKFTYDINVTTNYAPTVQAEAGVDGAGVLAEFILAQGSD